MDKKTQSERTRSRHIARAQLVESSSDLTLRDAVFIILLAVGIPVAAWLVEALR